jgi:hypothetical protein
MALLGDLLAEAFRELEESGIFNPDFTWNGATYKSIPNPSSKSGKLEPGGFGINADFVLFCRTNQFVGSAPTRGQTLTSGGTQYRIDDVVLLVEGVLEIHCVNATRGA